MFEKEESDLIIAEQNKSTEEILKAIAKVKSDYHELCKLKDKRIAELEDKLANADYQLEGRDIKIKELEKENAELKADNDARKFAMAMSEKVEKRLRDENAELKELIKNIIRVTWGEGWNYSLDWKVKAEQFLKNSEVEK